MLLFLLGTFRSRKRSTEFENLRVCRLARHGAHNQRTDAGVAFPCESVLETAQVGSIKS